MQRIKPFLIGLLCLVLLVSCSSAWAAKIKISLLGGNTAVNMYIIGKIEKGDSEKFKKAINEINPPNLPNLLINYVMLASPGGDVLEAMEIGNTIRTHFLGTFAPINFYGQNRVIGLQKKDLDGDNCTCASACFLIWAAGVERTGEILGLHRPYFSKKYFKGLSAIDARKKYLEMSEEVKKYLIKMDIPNFVIEKMFGSASDEIIYLDEETVKLISKVPFFDEWIRASCNPLSEEERHEHWRLVNKEWDPDIQGYNPDKLSKTENLLKKYLDEKDSRYGKCHHKKLREAQSQSYHIELDSN